MPSGWTTQIVTAGSNWAIGGTPCVGGGGMYQMRSTYGTLNDNVWLFTHGITLQANYSYSVKINLLDGNTLRVYAGGTATAAAMTSTGTLMGTFSTDGNCGVAQTSTAFVPSSNGTYYFAFNKYLGGIAVEIDNIEIYETPPACTYPSSQASSITLSNVNSDKVTVTWSRGVGGSKVLVVARPNSASNAEPADGGNYTANPAFGSGSQIGTGNYVVYDGTGTSVTVTELDHLTQYHFYVYEYNTTGPCYLRPGATNNTTTLRSTNYYINDATLNSNDSFTTAIGNNSNIGTRPSKPKLTLTNMLSSFVGTFQSGDTIFVDTGTFQENDLSSPINGVVIVGRGTNRTTFTKSGTNHYFMKIDDANTVLQDFLLDSYDYVLVATEGHALTIDGVTGVIINYVQVNNSDAGSGSFPILVKNNASANFNGGGSTCNAGGAAGGGIQIQGASTNVTLKNYILTGNQTNIIAGSAIQITGGTLNLRNSYIHNNEVSSNQVGPGLNQSGGTVNIYDCVFESNVSSIAGTFYGGHISISSGTLNITRSILKNNIANGANTYGGAIGVTGGTVTVDSCLFSGNSAFNGKDIAIDGGTLLARNCRFNSSGIKLFRNSGTFTYQDCGNLTDGVDRSGGFTINNTNNSTYTAAPSVPIFTGSCATSITLLPIELKSFSNKCKNAFVEVNWQTASELNNDKFIVYHSNDGENFNVIAEIKGAGNSSQERDYSYIHKDAPLGKNYYKLRQIDFDGNYTDSKVVVFDARCTNLNFSVGQVYFNANNNELKINLNCLENEKGYVQLYDISGRSILQNQISLSKEKYEYSIQLPFLSNGSYLVSLSDDGGGRFTQKLVITR